MSANPIFAIIVFVIIIILILVQPKIPIPQTKKTIQIDYGIAPVLGVIILWITRQINFNIIIAGINGTETIHPITIIILFFSLAYICISIDLTGFFAYLALSAAKKSGSSGKRLFFYFFLLSSVLTTFTSNDIVILTLTPIIVYFCKYTKTNPLPFLIGQFFAANIWSIALYIGNPTNIIVAQAYKLTFLGYSAWMVLPTIIAGISCYFLLLLVFRKDIPEKITPPDIDPSSAIKDKSGVIFGLIVLGSCLILLSIAPIFNLNMGVITFSFAILMLIRDIIHDILTYKRKTPINKDSSNRPSSESSQEKKTGKFSSKLQTVSTALSRMPWKIMPFVFGMFIMVEILGNAGLIQIFASTLGNLLSRTGLVLSIFIMCFFSAFSCNIMNNQPMTILFTETLLNSSFIATSEITQASMFALIMGSNFGANFTLIGALAGIMWSSISKEKGIPITYRKFASYGFRIMPFVIGLACLTLAIEFLIVFKIP